MPVAGEHQAPSLVDVGVTDGIDTRTCLYHVAENAHPRTTAIGASPIAVGRVAFYAELRFFESYLLPVVRAIGDRAETLLTADRVQIVAFRPHVLVLSHPHQLAYFRRHLPETSIGMVGHGGLRKGRVHRLRSQARAERQTFDFVCVGDETVADIYRLAGTEPKEFWHTGSPILDRLFRGDPPPDLRLDPEQPTVLFAPTWNLGLSAAPLLGDRLAELVRGSGPPLNLIIKPHPNIARIRGEWMRWWKKLAADDPRVFLADADADVTAYMSAADLLVSDASSAMLYFLALDRPIVLVTNPDYRFDPEYDPDDICWRWRDMGTEVTNPDQLAAAVAAGLAAPQHRGEARRRYADLLFGGHRDGHNALRIADRVLGLTARLGPALPPAIVPGPTVAWHRRWTELKKRISRDPRYLGLMRGRVEAIRLSYRRRRRANR